jgi:ATP-dependent DNA helicase RecQ
MTRARKNLSIFSVKNIPIPHIHLLDEADWQVKQLKETSDYQPKQANYKYELISLADIHLGYPGRFNKGGKIHQDLSNLHPGNIVYLVKENDSILIKNRQGRTISKMAKSAINKWSKKLPNIQKATVTAIITRTNKMKHPTSKNL